MASIKQLDERRYKITVSNGYRPNGKKISKAKTIQVPPGVPKRGIGQYVAHAAEELERSFKTGYAEDGEMTFEEFASRWLKRQTKYAPSTIAAYPVSYTHLASCPIFILQLSRDILILSKNTE